ncbi:MAG: adenylate/guanylate cyclase domain-containing protein [Aeromicrobium sp.]|uniref:adenylate/guanylate cyclase domain-containing protein n=1 Tax=Aeromicrobium sp. TaxID=1871063 RepID=UPI0039E22A46
MTDEAGGDAFDPAIVIEVAGSYLLGETPSLTRREVAERAEVPLEWATRLWRSLGFAEVGDDRAAFTAADVDALRAVRELFEQDVFDLESLPGLTRAMGSSFARLADWQSRMFLGVGSGEPAPLEALTEVIPLVEKVQSYIWRRHLVDATSRALLQASTDPLATPLAVGFVDIVGYTSRSRQLSTSELATMIETFEQTTSGIVVEAGGQVVKTIGDEVLYTIADPVASAEVALNLVEQCDRDPAYPQVRVGSAYGTVLARLGDVFGPVVNIAARLTSIARPGRVLVDAELARLLEETDFRLRRAPRASVKGYDHLEPWSLRRPKKR